MIHRLCDVMAYSGIIHTLLWHDFYDTIIDNTTLFYDIMTQIKLLLELCSFCPINEFYLTEAFNC